MAKRTTKTETAPVVETTKDDTKEFATQLKVLFYEQYKRQCTLNVEDMIKLVNDNANEQTMAKEWWFDKMTKAEEAKLRGSKTSLSITPETLADVINNDAEAQEFTAAIAPAQELPPKAPANISIFLRRDYNEQQLSAFAEPRSREKDKTDSDGAVVGNNRKIVWDYAEADTGEKYQWYLRFADRTTTGKAYNQVRDALAAVNQKVAGPIMCSLDGRVVNMKDIPDSERDNLLRQYNARRNKLADAYRRAYLIIVRWNEIVERMRDKVGVDYVWMDEDDKTKGLSNSAAPIRVKYRNEKGEFTGRNTDFTVNEFINLDVDQAMNDQGQYTYAKLIDSKRKKVQPVIAGSKEAKAKRALEDARKVDATNVPMWFEKMHDWIEKEGSYDALLSVISRMSPDTLEAYKIRVVHILQWMDKNLVTDDMIQFVKEKDRQHKDKRNSELLDRKTA